MTYKHPDGTIRLRTDDGQEWILSGSHNSVIRVGEEPKKHDNCPGCGTKRKVAQ